MNGGREGRDVRGRGEGWWVKCSTGGNLTSDTENAMSGGGNIAL